MNQNLCMQLAATKTQSALIARHVLSGDGLALGPLHDCLLDEGKMEHLLVGNCYFIETVTYFWVGRVVAASFSGVVLEEEAKVYDTGRFSDFIRTGVPKECEPVPDRQKVIIASGCFCDAVEWPHKLLRKQV